MQNRCIPTRQHWRLLIVATVIAGLSNSSCSTSRNSPPPSAWMPSGSTASPQVQRSAAAPAADPGYLLGARDQIELVVFDEPELSVSQRLDAGGQIRIPLLGTTRIAGMSIRQAEEMTEQLLIERRILKQPMVSIRVVEYAPKEASVLGAVNSPGKIVFPAEVKSLDIVEVISQVGGFSALARRDSVRVTRTLADGRENAFTVDVGSMLTGRGGRGQAAADVPIYPGDVLWIPERWY